MRLILKKEPARLIINTRHPWVFRQALAEDVTDENIHGKIVELYDDGGEFIGYGFYSAFSKIACRIISFDKALHKDWIQRRISSALAIRRRLKIKSNAYRIINAEGDNFPGFILDRYNNTLVLRPEIRGVEILIPQIVDVLKELFPHAFIFLKRDEKQARIEKLIYKTGYLVGSGEGVETIEENGLLFRINLWHGQKTGFYLDQRKNREILRNISSNSKVLDLFSYTGGFAINAMAGGASRVDAVESSSSALKMAQENHSLNHKEGMSKVKWFQMDSFKFLGESRRYDVLIMDPPPFARTRREVIGALKGYRFLHVRALSILNPGGFLFIFSCSHAVTKEMLLRVIYSSSRSVGRHVQVIRELGASSDHPWSIYHREADYMKGFLLYVH